MVLSLYRSVFGIGLSLAPNTMINMMSFPSDSRIGSFLDKLSACGGRWFPILATGCFWSYLSLLKERADWLAKGMRPIKSGPADFSLYITSCWHDFWKTKVANPYSDPSLQPLWDMLWRVSPNLSSSRIMRRRVSPTSCCKGMTKILYSQYETKKKTPNLTYYNKLAIFYI